jgi:glycosyltransferase involved in cell wall biosynthesis
MLPPTDDLKTACPKVSVITPTYQREAYLQQCYQLFKAQTYPHKEWLILDDSPAPSEFFSTLNDPDVRYITHPKKLQIGEKVSRLLQAASGDIVVHFDDDDIYAPIYCERMVAELRHADFVKLSGWFIHSVPHSLWGYCSMVSQPTEGEIVFCLTGNEPVQVLQNFKMDDSMRWGYGFTYAYWKHAVEGFPIPTGNNSWDFKWVLEQLLPAGVCIKQLEDTEGWVLRMHHGYNVSQTFFQYRLPKFTLPKVLTTNGGPGC